MDRAYFYCEGYQREELFSVRLGSRSAHVKDISLEVGCGKFSAGWFSCRC